MFCRDKCDIVEHQANVFAARAEARRLREQRLREGQRNPGDLEQVLSWLADVDEDTFYKWQRRASDAIAEALWQG
ncbi:MAG: hypothetical protein H7Z42_22890 [Roseiflexaceae bacterium]|nr:hypothetical protein [Roseiflexaceae bacterium]